MPRPINNPVAIIGIGCRFPGGIRDPRSFWDLLEAGIDAIVDVPADRWRADAYYDADPETPARMFVRQGGFLQGRIDGFDAGFFGMPPREAAALDPQQRLLLEVTWEAFEDAGVPPGTLAGANVGTFIGGFTFDAAVLQLAEANRHLVSAATPTGVSMTILSARLAYTFDLRGPTFTVDTACSSSLVAFHQACVALSRGECELALAGGVNVMVNPVTTILMSKGQFLSPDACCKSFDHRANGYARAEGAGIVLLKPLEDALRDGDHIYAVVRGSAVNQDGRTPGITVPSADAQIAAIRQACRSGDIDPVSIGYFEAHGTGTAVGDPIEAKAIGSVIAGSERKHWIGSVKSNFGHAEAAAGIAGVIKASLCLERGLIPPNLHFEHANPKIPFDKMPLAVPTQLIPFEGENGPRRAGVNSFGFGGTNAHAVLEQAPIAAVQAQASISNRPLLLPLSARSMGALHDLCVATADLLERADAPSLPLVCRASARQRDHHGLRTFVVATDGAEAAAALRRIESSPPPVGRGGLLTFVYTGMGPQWWGMGAELLDVPTFAKVVAECDRVLARFALCMAEEFRRPENQSRMTYTLYAQVGNFVLQTGLTAMWRSWGVEPGAIVGHSVGEVAAAYAAGVYSLEDALTISVNRASLQSRLAGCGAMAAVAASAHAVERFLTEGVSIAAINSNSATTLAGDPDVLAAVGERLQEAGFSVKGLKVEVAYHSPQMEAIREPLLQALRDIRPLPARIDLFSTVTGGRADAATMDARYWWRNVREPVRFAQAFEAIADLAPGVILEIGPHPVLAPSIDEVLSERRASGIALLASQRRNSPQLPHMLESLGALYMAGVDPDWTGVHPGIREHVDLPRYPWQREMHWIEAETSRAGRIGSSGLAFAGEAVAAPMPTRDIELSVSRFPFLADHRIGQTIVFPGSGYLETILAMFGNTAPCVLEDVAFLRPLTLPPRTIVTLRCTYDSSQHRVSLYSRGQGGEDSWTLHARLRLFRHAALPTPPPSSPSLVELTASLPVLTHETIYADLDRSSLNYGPAFRAVEQIWHTGSGDVVAEIRLDTINADGYQLHPALLDAALQAVISSAPQLSDERSASTYVPAQLEAIRFFRRPGRQLWLRGRPRPSQGPDGLECDVTLFTDEGEVVAELIGLRAQRLADGEAEPDSIARLVYEHAWRKQALERSGDTEGIWVVVGDADAVSGLARGLRARGGTVLHIVPENDWPERVASMVSIGTGCRGVVSLTRGSGFRDGVTEAVPVCAPVEMPLRLVQALQGKQVFLFIVTTGTQSVSDTDETSDPFAGSLWGFGRVVNAERPELRCRLIDISGDIETRPNGIDALIDELASNSADDVALRACGRYVRRLERAAPHSLTHHVAVRCDSTRVHVRSSAPGLDGLGFAATTRRDPGPTEVEIETAYVGLNFKDVLKVTGLLAREAMNGSYSQETIGLECSGTVTRVGSAVMNYEPGDEVFAHSRDLFCSYVTLEAIRVAKKPIRLSLAEAASLLPAVTAYLSLVELARVRPGERVLIHSAAGGVGLAAVRIAKWLGAEVFATASGEVRRDMLRREGVAMISDSRRGSFADDVLRHTGGEGVDVIVNSQPGDILHKGLRLLRPFGRFVELGKSDIAADNPIGLSPFRRALSFHALDYDQMMLLDPERVLAVMRDVAALYEEGVLAPSPLTEFTADDVGAAFRAMTRREHVGKIVLRMEGESVLVPASTLSRTQIRDDATYLITGGLGGLGLRVTRWLADCGARRLVLVGRSGIASREAEQSLAELGALGVEVVVEKVDVARRGQVEDLLSRHRIRGRPVRGIIHAAADFDDVVLTATTPERLLAATRPKACGAWNLHLATRGDTLDFFVLFSSVAAQIGAGAAGAYATANEFLNALARHRHALGLPAISIGWGMIGEVGVAVSRNGMVGNVLRRNGHVALAPARLVAELETLLQVDAAEVSIADIQWERWAAANPQLAPLPRYSTLVPAGGVLNETEETRPARLRGMVRAERANMLAELVGPLLQQVTGLTLEQVAEQHVVDIDSLAAVELRLLIENAFGLRIPSVQLQRNLSSKALADLLSDAFDQISADASGLSEEIVVHDFQSSDGLTVHGHLSLPSGPGPHPAVVVCTPGAGGALDEHGRYLRIAEHAPLHAAGFAVFTVDWRGAPGHGAEFSALAEMGGGEIDDIVAAARYLADMPEIDSSGINLLGVSRGAYSGLLALARDARVWRHAVLFMGLFDPTYLVATERNRPGTLLPSDHRVNWRELDAHFAVAERQPLTLLDRVASPLFAVHGEADDVIPLEQAVAFEQRAKRVGLPVRLLTVPDLAHDIDYASPVWSGIWPEVVTFLLAQGSVMPTLPG